MLIKMKKYVLFWALSHGLWSKKCARWWKQRIFVHHWPVGALQGRRDSIIPFYPQINNHIVNMAIPAWIHTLLKNKIGQKKFLSEGWEGVYIFNNFLRPWDVLTSYDVIKRQNTPLLKSNSMWKIRKFYKWAIQVKTRCCSLPKGHFATNKIMTILLVKWQGGQQKSPPTP